MTMLAILLNPDDRSAKDNQALANLLASYGLKDVVKLDYGADIAYLIERYQAHSEVVFIGTHPGLTNLAIRRLTLSSVRLPSRLTVWDGPAQRRLVAARVPWDSLRKSFSQGYDNVEDAVRALGGSDGITAYTLQQFTSTDVLRIGGSFSKSGIRRHFFKNASGRGALKLLDEVQLYKSLPPPLRDHYPRLLFAEQDERGVSMGIEYQEYPNLRDLLLNLQIGPTEAVELLKQVLDYEYRQVFLGYQQPTPPNYLHDYHYHRVWRRIIISKELDPQFNRLIEARWLEVNGQKLPNIPAMLLQLEQSKKAAVRLDPGSVSPFIHADLHLENILCDVSGKRFWLVDPRGYPCSDIYYDLGKLAHSYNSNYDLLHEGRHEASFAMRDDTAVVNFHFTSPVLTKTYAELNKRMQPVIHELLGAQGSTKDIDLRVRFNEAMHFCSDMPFHINPNQTPNVAIPIYVIGAKLLAEVLRLLDIDPDTSAEQQSAGLERLAVMGKQRWVFEG
ncbi:MAG: hypothetical protein M1834_006421 [Cirrosporium novae-zelandiae]|nr:MAG: hypothetical protein M1834_006421 [Cirrosporium novae-zelandiae]